jgi:hypothetical protein
MQTGANDSACWTEFKRLPIVCRLDTHTPWGQHRCNLNYLPILSCQIMEQDPQHGVTPELININMYGMFYNWVLLGGI